MTVKRLIELRQLKSLPKVEIAKTLQIPLKRYNRIERGTNKPSKREHQRMNDFLQKYEIRRTPEYRKMKSETIQVITGRMDLRVEDWRDLDDDDEDLNDLRELFGIPRKDK